MSAGASACADMHMCRSAVTLLMSLCAGVDHCGPPVAEREREREEEEEEREAYGYRVVLTDQHRSIDEAS